MAGASLNDIKARIKSVKSTMQITKAMELVATSKLRRAKELAERTRPFRDALGSAVSRIAHSEFDEPSSYIEGNGVKKALYVIIAGDRGLAGGYNSNVFKFAEAHRGGEDAVWLPIGKKALEYCERKGYEMLSDAYGSAEDVSVGDSIAIGDTICEGFLKGLYGKVTLVYTEFVSMLTQSPTSEELLPLRLVKDNSPAVESDEDASEMLNVIVPSYIGGVVWSAMKESVASETGARRTAMNSANKNASEMIDELSLRYNRARQAVITQEITEIVSGAEAL